MNPGTVGPLCLLGSCRGFLSGGAGGPRRAFLCWRDWFCSFQFSMLSHCCSSQFRAIKRSVLESFYSNTHMAEIENTGPTTLQQFIFH